MSSAPAAYFPARYTPGQLLHRRWFRSRRTTHRVNPVHHGAERASKIQVRIEESARGGAEFGVSIRNLLQRDADAARILDADATPAGVDQLGDRRGAIDDHRQ